MNYVIPRTMRTERSKQPASIRSTKDDQKFGCLLLTVIGTAILGVCRADISLFILPVATGLVAGFWDDLRGKGTTPSIIMRFALIGILVAFFFTAFSGQAHALWLEDIETWMTDSFPNTTDIAALVFNVIRAIVVVLLAVSAVQVFMAIKRQEGLFEAAKLPIVTLLILEVVDITAGFVIA